MRNLALMMAVAAMISFSSACIYTGAANTLGSDNDAQGHSRYAGSYDGATAIIAGGSYWVGEAEQKDNGSGGVSHANALAASNGIGDFGDWGEDGILSTRAQGDRQGRTNDDNGDGAAYPTFASLFATDTGTFSAGTSFTFAAQADSYNDDPGGTAADGTWSSVNDDLAFAAKARVTGKGQGVAGKLSYNEICQLLQSIRAEDVADSATSKADDVTVHVTAVNVNGETLTLNRGDLSLTLEGSERLAVNPEDPSLRMVGAWFADQLDAVRARGEEPQVSTEINGVLTVEADRFGDTAFAEGDVIRQGLGLE